MRQAQSIRKYITKTGNKEQRMNTEMGKWKTGVNLSPISNFITHSLCCFPISFLFLMHFPRFPFRVPRFGNIQGDLILKEEPWNYANYPGNTSL